MKYLITNADDFGYTDDINQAIIDSHNFGILTSASVLINTISRQGLELIKQTPTMGFGIHLNLTKGDAVTKQWQDKYGELYRPNRGGLDQFDQELWIEFFKQFNPEIVYKELKAQIELFIKLVGQPPTHLDSHHYVSTYNSVFDSYLKLAKEYKLPVRQALIWQESHEQSHWGSIESQQKQTEVIRENKIPTPDLTPLKYIYQFENRHAVLEKEISKIQDGQTMEFYFHPGLKDKDRVKDFNFLVEEGLDELISKHEIKLVNYSHLHN